MNNWKINENGLFVKRARTVLGSLLNNDAAGQDQRPGAPPRPGLGDISEFLPRGPGGCKLMRADDLPGACYRDNCGRTFVKAGGSWIENKNPSSIREKVMAAALEFPTSATPITFGTEIQPETPYFVPRSLIIDIGVVPVGSGYTLNHLVTTNLKIGTRDQSISKMGNTTGATGYSAFLGGVFGPGAFNNLIDFDPATPQLGIKVSGVLAAGTPVVGQVVVYNYAFFGITFESLQLSVIA